MSDKEFITKHYNCKYCNKTHEIQISKEMLENRRKYPFPYVFLHDNIQDGQVSELLTILYIDQDGRIRGQEIQELDNDNLFSREQVIAIVKPLSEEIERLREDNQILKQKLENVEK
ncbi:MAG: hypothetical protein BAJALOKI3v1_480001 [Promethearchaeota archaeon]|jgi:hypothetical protein|nr:MAG: hypothetical protein BAJALOKI3v1_480001 [Candidatus Lokiarchaeota archaeon]